MRLSPSPAAQFQATKTRAVLGGVAGCNHRLEGRGHPRRECRAGEPQIRGPDDLALAHGDAAEHLGEVFAHGDSDQQLLDLSPPSGGLHALPVAQELGISVDPKTLGDIAARQAIARRLASGPLADVALAIKGTTRLLAPPVAIFSDKTGRAIDLDLRGSNADVLARLPSLETASPDEPAPPTAIM